MSLREDIDPEILEDDSDEAQTARMRAVDLGFLRINHKTG